MASPQRPHTTTAERILTAISLPTTVMGPTTPAPLPLVELSALPRDGSLRYTIAQLDTSGRIADQSTVAAMGWHPGQRLDTTVIENIVLIRPTGAGTATVSTKGRLLIPADTRHRAGLATRHVFIVAAPTAGLVLVHGLRCLDNMLTLHYRTIFDSRVAP